MCHVNMFGLSGFAYVIVCKTGRHSPAHGAAISRRTCPGEGLEIDVTCGLTITTVLVMEIIGALLKSDLFNSSHLV